MRRRNVAIGLAIVAVVAFVFLVPVVPDGINLCSPAVLGCPVSLGNHPATVSVSYYAVGAGGRVLGTTYQILFWPGWVCQGPRNDPYDCHQIMWSEPY
jgi:hypothetical protein